MSAVAAGVLGPRAVPRLSKPSRALPKGRFFDRELSRLDFDSIVKQVLARAVLSKHKEGGLGQVFKCRKLQVTTKPSVRIYADNVQLGRTPATITAELSALRVILPR